MKNNITEAYYHFQLNAIRGYPGHQAKMMGTEIMRQETRIEKILELASIMQTSVNRGSVSYDDFRRLIFGYDWIILAIYYLYPKFGGSHSKTWAAYIAKSVPQEIFKEIFATANKQRLASFHHPVSKTKGRCQS